MATTNSKNILIFAVLTGTKDGGFARSFRAWGKESREVLGPVQENFVAEAIRHTADMINMFASKASNYAGMTVQMVVPDSVAIKSYQLMKLTGTMSVAQASKEAMSQYDEKVHQEAYKALATALVTARKAGVSLRISRQSELSGFDIVVPKGIIVEEGDILSFVDGVTDDGVTFSNGMVGNYTYTVGVRKDGTLYARRPESRSTREMNEQFSNTLNLVRPLPTKVVDDASGVF